ncbi:MAG: molybdopterin-dependent oxidoreductase, partial [Sulfuricellaceae bacterium]|nr:molybdopterin-dependent oxidoreductase [Sulfuricellaceae bacterium]
LCSKGAALGETLSLDDRLLHPEIDGQRVTWDAALDSVAQRFQQVIAEHGPDAVAFYVSGQLLTEDYYVANKLMKGFIGSGNIDTNSRLCMSSAVAGYKATLGADAPPACYEDIHRTACLFIAGSNTAYAHPVLFRRIEEARAANPDLKLIVADPRRTDTAAAADLHLALLPGTDVALFNGMLHVLVWEGLIAPGFIRDHTRGFAALKEAVREYTPRTVSGICGVPEADIVLAAKWFGSSPATLSLYCQGLNQSIHGTAKNTALINLHLATGQIGKPGAGPLSLTGQANAMGGRETGTMATLLPGHRNLNDFADRAEVARFWGIDRLPEPPGKTALELFEAAARGEIKALWIACTNPAQSLPNQALVRAALERVDLVVLQEAWGTTETAAYADVLLPAATWPEKSGTMTNSERCISRIQAALPPPGEARADWEIVADFARRYGRLCGKPAEALFPYRNSEQIFDEFRELTRGRDLDITGLSYAMLEREGPQQWPFPEGAQGGAARLYRDGVFATPDGRARFVASPYQATAEEPDADYPLRLNTGRLRDQWHGMSRTGQVAKLYGHAPEPLLDMNPHDMACRNLADGDLVNIASRRGKMVLKARAVAESHPGQVFVPMHWGAAFVSGHGANGLTTSARDAESLQPELKHAAVAVEKIELPWRLTVLRAGNAAGYLLAVRPLLERFPFASATLFGQGRPLLVFQAAAASPLEESALRELDRLLEMDDTAAFAYSDARRGISKRICVREGKLEAVRLGGDTAAGEWLKGLMAEGQPVEALGRWLLSPGGVLPDGATKPGRVVCNCLNVSDIAIREALESGQDVPGIQESLKCGTQCGSCLPEIRRMAESARLPA